MELVCFFLFRCDRIESFAHPAPRTLRSGNGTSSRTRASTRASTRTRAAARASTRTRTAARASTRTRTATRTATRTGGVGRSGLGGRRRLASRFGAGRRLPVLAFVTRKQCTNEESSADSSPRPTLPLSSSPPPSLTPPPAKSRDWFYVCLLREIDAINEYKLRRVSYRVLIYDLVRLKMHHIRNEFAPIEPERLGRNLAFHRSSATGHEIRSCGLGRFVFHQ